jgi:hypothetical protein
MQAIRDAEAVATWGPAVGPQNRHPLQDVAPPHLRSIQGVNFPRARRISPELRHQCRIGDHLAGLSAAADDDGLGGGLFQRDVDSVPMPFIEQTRGPGLAIQSRQSAWIRLSTLKAIS